MVFSEVFYYLLIIYISNLLLSLEYGDMVVIIRTLLFMSSLLTLGVQFSQNRYLGKYDMLHQKNFVKGIITWSKNIVTKTCFSSMIIGNICMLLIASGYIKQFNDWQTYFFPIWLSPVFAYIFWQASLIHSLRYYITSILFNKVFLYVLFFIMAIVAAQIGVKINLFKLILFLLSSGLFILLFQEFFIRFKLDPYNKSEKPEFKKHEWWQHAKNVYLYDILIQGTFALEMLLFEVLGKNESDLGYLGAILLIAGLIQLPTGAVYYYMRPHVTILCSNSQDNHQTFRFYSYLRLFPTLVIYGLIVLFSKELLALFGAKYSQYSDLLIITTSFFLVVSLFRLSEIIMELTGKVRKRYFFLQIIVLLAGSVLLIPIFQLYGAIYAICLSQLSMVALATLVVKKYYKIKIFLFF